MQGTEVFYNLGVAGWFANVGIVVYACPIVNAADMESDNKNSARMCLWTGLQTNGSHVCQVPAACSRRASEGARET